jgi:hypothetical protein
VLGQALVGRVGLGREDQVGQLALQATTSHSKAVPADAPWRVTVTQIEPGPEFPSSRRGFYFQRMTYTAQQPLSQFPSSRRASTLL